MPAAAVNSTNWAPSYPRDQKTSIIAFKADVRSKLRGRPRGAISPHLCKFDYINH